MTKTEALKVLMQDTSGFFNNYYELIDGIIADAMKENIRDFLSDDTLDEFETLDNKTSRLSAFCRVLEFYSTIDDYRAFMKELQGV